MSQLSTPAISAPVGGGFLLEDSSPESIFTPEDFSTEQRQIAATTAAFAEKEVLPVADALESKDFDLLRKLMRKAGDLGLLGVDVPEDCGGLALDKVTSAIVAENISRLASFSVAFSAHVGIGTLPLVWYGTEEQQQKYLPRLASGEWIAAYALSEASSGSDAMNIRTRATLSPDGQHYVLNGEKMWITNAGVANLFTLFARIVDPVDPDPAHAKFSAFLIERDTPGLTVGPEEHKLGIRGSSTCPLILSDCKVPVASLLGEAGKGHHIAFNILNIGRFKLGAACLGGAKHSLADSITYARDRKAFGKSITEFGLIQQKIADAAARIFVGESMTYRAIGAIDAALAAIPREQAAGSREIQKRIEAYAIECSILKVWASEMLGIVTDHGVQIHAGYGYVEDYPAERAWRDARINRIFEGTNEINRLIISGFLMKRAVSGQLPLLPAIQKLMDEVLAPPSLSAAPDASDPLIREAGLLTAAKKITLFAAGIASQKYGAALIDQQEIMAALADLTTEVYALESALLRARKLRQAEERAERVELAESMTALYAISAFEKVTAAAELVAAAVAEGDTLRTHLAILRRFARHEPANAVTLSRQIAAAAVVKGRYPLTLA
uniref:Acyl-CoA dehydrogenase n=1 Tax=Acidobacterium capsulatum TaxID=33075 RepID=A0A7V5CTB4_9BACT